MPRRQGTALLIALVAGTAALAAFMAYAGSALFSRAGSQQVGAQPAARPPAAPAHSTGVWVATWAGAPMAGVAERKRRGGRCVRRDLKRRTDSFAPGPFFSCRARSLSAFVRLRFTPTPPALRI
ncbi:hypothetical protein ACWD6R_22295 [Streptomyces sp. NPDC005151]